MLKNIPNILTILRFILIPIILYFIFTGNYTLAFIFFTLSGATDVLDGCIARKFNLISNLIFYHDLNVSKLNVYELKEFIDSIGKDNINLLFSLKRADLLAQSSQYHYLMNNVNIQEQKIIKSLKK